MSSGKQQQKKKQARKKGQGRFQDESDAKWENPTPKGQLKSFEDEMEAGYNPTKVEAAWDAYWEEQGFFKADSSEASKDKEKFVIVIPPPNVTGTLHIGHALTCAIEDALVRWHRMCGKETLWVPGSDHAGIATQVVVEKKLMKEQQKTRHDLGREAFLKEVWKWKEQNGNIIFSQLRRLGASVDWSRAVFTMDETRCTAVTEAFVRMAQKGLIYRADRIVNWSCSLRTAISSIEVDHIDVDKPTMLSVPGYDKPVEFGVLHSFAYKFVDQDKFGADAEIVVSTTRIETMLGDVAVAVHPDDERYTKYHGAKLKHPFFDDRELVIVTDGTLVDMAFGTGAVKITPGHDPNDFECGQRHKLPIINILDESGMMNENAGPYKGMGRFDVRTKIIDDIKALGLYRGKEPNKMTLGQCSRSKDIVEPIVRPQWWVATKGMAARAVDAVRKGDLKIIPESHHHTWYNFLEDPQEWCISRQLWWGHRIPAYYVTLSSDDDTKSTEEDPERWVVGRTEEEALDAAVKKFNVDRSAISLRQDPDVLDTWFSSGLFPFSVMGWPEDTADMRSFYPGHVLETGWDILFFWVARMVMMGLELTDQLPFKTVFLHSMVRDKDKKKMSKSLGNVIDPIDVMDGVTLQELHDKLHRGNLAEKEIKRATAGQKKMFPDGIAQCGADALRFGLLAYCGQGRDINLDVQRVVGYRQFCNKLWNATKFGLINFDDDFKAPDIKTDMCVANGGSSTLADKWILSRLHKCVVAMDKAFNDFQLGDATTQIYDFWLKEFCKEYLEAIKPIMRSKDDAAARLKAQQVLFTCFTYGLRLLHPIMPFVTEELYHRLPGSAERIKANGHDSIMVSAYPRPADTAVWENAEAEEHMELVREVVGAARSARDAFGMANKERPAITIVSSDAATTKKLEQLTNEIASLSNSGSVGILEDEAKVPAGCTRTPISSVCTLFMDVSNVNLVPEVTKLRRRLADLEASVAKLTAASQSAGYAKAPERVRAANKAKLENDTAEVASIQESISKYEELMSESDKAQVELSLVQMRVTRLQKDIKLQNKTLAKSEAKLAKGGDTMKEKAKTKLVASIDKYTQSIKRDTAELEKLEAQVAELKSKIGSAGAGGAPASTSS
eukprot:TRINITY_DN67889_c8_g2_i1.p1 TRINITY_DN67889_c8_g2~~TRINITY_DN67889_c8_g2_i1.p1  ORF type:complete len:1124 (+),score=661.45 TRINITY_DN67889_c8_g2_i1:467-3838(+)